MRLDEVKLEELRHWAHALREAGDEGSRASGRAILMLIEELEGLHLELRRAREQLNRLDSNTEAGQGDTIASTLHARLQRGDADSEQSPEAQPAPVDKADPSVEGDGNTESARSWIETLRRQKSSRPLQS